MAQVHRVELIQLWKRVLGHFDQFIMRYVQNLNARHMLERDVTRIPQFVKLQSPFRRIGEFIKRSLGKVVNLVVTHIQDGYVHTGLKRFLLYGLDSIVAHVNHDVG